MPFFNRLLIPFGLHHALNNVFWFDTIGLGDLTNFWPAFRQGMSRKRAERLNGALVCTCQDSSRV